MSPAVATLRTIRTEIPARLDRLPWSRFHWRVVIALGTVWILDGLEVTIVGSIGSRLTEHGSGIAMSASSIGTAAAFYVAGACLGALFFGQLTDRYGRKRLMMLTLGVYILATVATAFSTAPWMFFLFRFLTGTGIGGEYAAINSAIDELIPARNRGQVDITINGSYWVGSGVGGLAALLFLDQSIFATNFGWRLGFGIGALLGVLILLVRRTLPESPRWLFIHGREDEAGRIVAEIEGGVRSETGTELPPPRSSVTVHQRAAIPFREIARTAWSSSSTTTGQPPPRPNPRPGSQPSAPSDRAPAHGAHDSSSLFPTATSRSRTLKLSSCCSSAASSGAPRGRPFQWEGGGVSGASEGGGSAATDQRAMELVFRARSERLGRPLRPDHRERCPQRRPPLLAHRCQVRLKTHPSVPVENAPAFGGAPARGAEP
jgi:Sugar (and other) transporter